jgi:tRNA dimethylallyltransferase
MNDELSEKTLIVIIGPTASGKTAAAIQLAHHYKTDILSADSRQFYQEMSIGTAKPSKQELAAAKHFFINNLSITENYTAWDYEVQALELLNKLFDKHNYVILAGGSGLFIKAVCEGFDEFPDMRPGLREKLNLEFEEKGIADLQQRLKIADPVYYEQVDLNNPQRLIRAIEVFESTGKPFSSFRKLNVNKRPFRVVKLGLNLPREKLYQQINYRVDEMVKNGLIEEVKSLLAYRHLNALNTVGYSELFNYFDEQIDLDRAIELIKQNTRRFAKRQITWFGRDKEIIWMRPDNKDLIAEMVSAIK